MARPLPQQPRRIVVVRLSAIGDVIHTLPAVEALRAAWPTCHISWVVEPPAALFVQGHPAVDAVHVLRRRQWRRQGWSTLVRESHRTMKAVRALKPELAIDFQGLARSGVVTWLTGAPARLGFAGPESREGNALWMTHRVAAPPEAQHVIDKNLALVAALGVPIPTPGLAPPPRFPPLPAPDAAWRPCGDPGPRIALNPGAGWEAKRWPPAHFAELALALRQRLPQARLFVTIGPGEAPLLEAIHEGLRQRGARPATILEPLPVLDLLALASFLSTCQLMVAGDTGPIHIAAALGVPVVGLYAEFPAERNGPYGQRVEVLSRSPVGGSVRQAHAPASGYTIATITPGEVIEACMRALATR